MGGAIEVSHVSWRRPGGPVLLDEVSFAVGEGHKVALVGANGVGKTTLLRLIAGDEQGHSGVIRVDGRLGVMHQLVGMVSDATTVRDLYLALSPGPLRAAGEAGAAPQRHLQAEPTRERGIPLTQALARPDQAR